MSGPTSSKRRRRQAPSTVTSETAQAANISTTDQTTVDLVQSCIRDSIPMITQSVLLGLQQQSDTNHEASPSPATTIAAANTCLLNLTQPESTTSPGLSSAVSKKPVALGIDSTLKAKIVANEYIEFRLLLPKYPNRNDMQAKFVTEERDGSLAFVRAQSSSKIESLITWTRAFHIFVSVYCTRYPELISDLMQYAESIYNISKTAGDMAAINYDIQFRRWREADPESCPWDRKNPELFQDAIVSGLAFKMRPKQPFRLSSSFANRKGKPCFKFNNNNGKCPRGSNCPFSHTCEQCGGSHDRKRCLQSRKFDTSGSTSIYPKRTISSNKSVNPSN